MKKEYIKRVFTDWNNLKQEGIWFSGKTWEGEFKKWHPNDKLFQHYFFKNGLCDGEYKSYFNGKLDNHKLYKDGVEVKDYLK